MNQYYHVTPLQNVDSILSEGLKPQIGPRSRNCGEMTAAVFLFSSLDALETAGDNWLFDEFEEDERLALLIVSVPELPQIPGAEFEAFCVHVIGPENIRLLTEDVGEVTSDQLRKLAT